jgi:hypothetical protein
MRLLLVPFPYKIPENSFALAFPRTPLRNKTSHAAFFKLRQRWLRGPADEPMTGDALAKDIVLPLIRKAKLASGGLAPNGVVLPKCALSPEVAEELVAALASSKVEFLITGVLERDSKTGRYHNQAKTYVIVDRSNVVWGEQNKHHRWRIDQAQADSYGLDFDPDKDNHQWWEDIDVSKRCLPFYALRRDMSMATLICEDLARMDPAMSAIRAVGPNLVVALLMDGPQLGARWPGRYTGVLADEPGCAVLSLTCAGTVDLSNRHYEGKNPGKATRRTIARWAQADATSVKIDLDDGDEGVLLKLLCAPKHQTTLDNRSDQSVSRELSFISHTSLRAK